MERRTHIILGIFLFVALWSVFKFDLMLSVLAAGGTVFPDLDYRKMPNTRHRKLLHNIWVLATMAILIILLTTSLEFTLAFSLGFIGHVLIDSLTPMGVYPLYPIRRHRAWFMIGGKAIITFGSKGEKVFQFLFALLTVILFVWMSGILV